MDNDIPSWKAKSSVVATNNFKGGVLAGKYLAKHLKAGDKLGVLAGVPGVPALDARVNGMLAGLGSLRSQVKVVGKLQTDCAQDKGFTAAQTILTANPDIKAMFSACGPPAMGATTGNQAGEHRSRGHHHRRLRRTAGRGRRDQVGERRRECRPVPGEDRLCSGSIRSGRS